MQLIKGRQGHPEYNRRIAIAHDFLNSIGGAERVTLALSEIFPEAPIYTLFFNPKKTEKFFDKKNIITSGLQKKAEFLGFRHKYLLPFMPQAAEQFNFSKFDVVISSQSAWMKGILTKPETIHISYCHTPTRFLWIDSQEYLKQQKLGFIKRYAVRKMLNKLRIWDRVSADRVDYWIANSGLTAKRIKKYYKKDAEVIYPPTDTDRFRYSNVKNDYFLLVSRLSPYKMVGLAVDAFNKLGLELIIIGEGSEKEELQRRAKSNIKFLGFQKDEDILKYYSECRALIFPTFDEDFGLTPVEAMSCGKPVISAGRGGAKESIIEGVTGEFFNKEDPYYLAGAVKFFLSKENSYSPKKIREQALKFDKKVFEEKIKKFVEVRLRRTSHGG